MPDMCFLTPKSSNSGPGVARLVVGSSPAAGIAAAAATGAKPDPDSVSSVDFSKAMTDPALKACEGANLNPLFVIALRVLHQVHYHNLSTCDRYLSYVMF